MSRSALIALCMAMLAAAAGRGSAADPAQPRAEPPSTIEAGPGKVLPLAEILAVARRMVPGRVIEVELESDMDIDDDSKPPRWIYEVEILTGKNQVVELEFDAKTGQLLEIEGAPWPKGVPKPTP